MCTRFNWFLQWNSAMSLNLDGITVVTSCLLKTDMKLVTNFTQTFFFAFSLTAFSDDLSLSVNYFSTCCCGHLTWRWHWPWPQVHFRNSATMVKCHFCCAHHCTPLHCTPLHATAHHCTPLHTTALHCTGLDWTGLDCTALYWTALHCTALHCTALHCTVHCTALHCAGLNRTAQECMLWLVPVYWVKVGWGSAGSWQSMAASSAASFPRYQGLVPIHVLCSCQNTGNSYDQSYC